MLEKLDSACATCLHGSMSRGVLPAPILPPLASLDPRLPPPLCAQILKGVFSSRYGTYKGAAIFQAILFIASNFCGTFCVTSNSRMLFAFARDHGVLGSRWWKQVQQGLEDVWGPLAGGCMLSSSPTTHHMRVPACLPACLAACRVPSTWAACPSPSAGSPSCGAASSA